MRNGSKDAGRYSMPPTAGSLAMRFILYQRDDCQLCDQALDLLAQVRAPEFDSVFIDGDAVLEPRYGDRVPVLRDGIDGRELGWPFDVAKLRDWLGCS
jgi:hypothetical protein